MAVAEDYVLLTRGREEHGVAAKRFIHQYLYWGQVNKWLDSIRSPLDYGTFKDAWTREGVRDPCGGTVLTWCILQTMVRPVESRPLLVGALKHLVRQHPELVSRPYGAADFKGETPLHLAAAFNLLEVAQELLAQTRPSYDAPHGEGSQWARLLFFRRVTGKFFQPGSSAYFGETALHFAVSLGHCDMVDLLLNQWREKKWIWATILLMPDTFGCSCFHLAALHGKDEMFKHLFSKLEEAAREAHRGRLGDGHFGVFQDLKKCKEGAPLHFTQQYGIHEEPEPLETGGDKTEYISETDYIALAKHWALHITGPNGLTPMQLAAVNGRHIMFEICLESLQMKMWAFNRVSARRLHLDQIDTVRIVNKAKEDRPKYDYSFWVTHPGPWQTLELVYLYELRHQASSRHLRLVLTHKWRYLRRFFGFSMAVHATILGLLSWLVIEYKDSYHDAPNNASHTVQCLEIIVFTLVLLRMAVTMTDAAIGLHREVRRRGMLAALQRDRPAELHRTVTGMESGDEVYEREFEFAPPTLERQVAKRNAERELFPLAKNEAESSWLHVILMFISSRMPLSEFDYISVIGQICFIIHFCLFVPFTSTDRSSTTVMLALAALQMYVATFQYSCFSNELCSLVNSIVLGIVKDVFFFLLVYMVFLVAFALALYVLLGVENDKEDTLGWPTIQFGLDFLTRLSFGSTGDFADSWYAGAARSSYRGWVYMLYLSFSVLSIVILLNLLISMFSTTYEAVQGRSKQLGDLAWGRRILLLERRLMLLYHILPDCLGRPIREHLHVNMASGDRRAFEFGPMHYLMFLREETANDFVPASQLGRPTADLEGEMLSMREMLATVRERVGGGVPEALPEQAAVRPDNVGRQLPVGSLALVRWDDQQWYPARVVQSSPECCTLEWDMGYQTAGMPWDRIASHLPQSGAKGQEADGGSPAGVYRGVPLQSTEPSK